MLAAAAAWVGISPAAVAQTPSLSSVDETRLRALAEVVLPSELGARGRADVVDGFLRWIRNYREGAEMDHGYGFTRLRRTSSSPALRYPAQLAALDTAAHDLGFAFESLAPAGRQRLIAVALRANKVDRLPPRPTGEHIATDLMAFYFNGVEANDLAYGVAIGRDECRGLNDSEKRPGSERGQNGVRVRVRLDSTLRTNS
jgi:hypothetical protein